MSDLHPLDPIGSFEMRISVARQHAPQKIAHVAIVLNYQNAPLLIRNVPIVFEIGLIHLKLVSHC